MCVFGLLTSSEVTIDRGYGVNFPLLGPRDLPCFTQPSFQVQGFIEVGF